MVSFGKKRLTAALLAGALILGARSSAHADVISLDYSVDGGSTWTKATLTPDGKVAGQYDWSAVIKDASGNSLFSVDGAWATTNTPGGAKAQISQVNGTITALYDTSETHTLSVRVSSQGFLLPSVNSTLRNTSSLQNLGDVYGGGSANVVFTSYADTSNTLFGTTGSTVASTSVSYQTVGGESGAKNSSTSFFPSGATYSLTNEGDYTMTGGVQVSVVQGATTVTATPVPAGIVMALSGVPFLAAGGWLRRRRRK
jgi:hypothetical protein